jgi:serine O-acetyltransferase
MKIRHAKVNHTAGERCGRHPDKIRSPDWKGYVKTCMGMFAEDLKRYRAKGYQNKDLWLDPAVWAIASYRLSNWLYRNKPMMLIRIPLKLVSFVIRKFCIVVMEMDLDPKATIGGGLYIGHIGGVHINPGAVLGQNCDVAHRVTIGASAMGRQGIPMVGNGVYIGTGATLVGKIKIGDGAKIAANTLVMTNVPAGATVMGVPGRVVVRAKVATPPPEEITEDPLSRKDPLHAH